MTTWEVLKWDDSEEPPVWYENGPLEGEYYGPAANEVGMRHGSGTFLLLSQDGRYVRIVVGARTEFYEVSVEEAEPEPLSAAAVMEREA